MTGEIALWEERFRQQAQAANTNTTAQDRDPQAAARARRLAPYARVTPPVAEALPDVISREANQRHNAETIAQYPWMSSFLGDPDAAALVPKGGLTAVGNVVDTLGRKAKSAPQHPDTIDPRLTQSSFFGTRADSLGQTADA